MFFLTIFPWWAFVAALFFVGLVEYLIHRFRFAYRSSLLKIFAGILVCAVFLGVAIDFTPFHSFLLDEADRGKLPFFGQVYESIREAHRDQGVFRGVVDSVSSKENSFVISHDDFDNDSDDGVYTVFVPDNFDVNTLQSGDRVYVAGTSSNGIIRAYGIGRF